MPKQSSDKRGKRRGAKRYPVIQKPARPGTITYEQALEAVRWVKQHRTLTKPS